MPIDGSTMPGCRSTYKALIDKRREQGFSVVQMAFQSHTATGGGVDSFMARRKDPALTVAFWQQVDRSMDYANENGIVPVIGMTFHSGMDRHSLEDWKFLWRYVIARYGAHSVTWLVCGEYNLKDVGTEDRVAKTMALGAFVKEADPYKRAMTVHPWWHGGDEREAWRQPWYDFIMLQGGHHGHGKVPPTAIYREAWEHQPPRPVIEAECNYEGIHAGRAKGGHTPDDVRRVAYHAIQAGSFGFTYGAHGLWYPTQDARDARFDDWGTPMVWWEALERPGARMMGHLRACYESVEWWKLVPRPGAVGFSGAVRDATRPLVKSDGDTVHLVWFPQGSGAGKEAVLTLAAATGARSYAAAWFNPRDGRRTAIAGPLPVANGTCPLPARPDDEDWMLILRRGD